MRRLLILVLVSQHCQPGHLCMLHLYKRVQIDYESDLTQIRINVSEITAIPPTISISELCVKGLQTPGNRSKGFYKYYWAVSKSVGQNNAVICNNSKSMVIYVQKIDAEVWRGMSSVDVCNSITDLQAK